MTKPFHACALGACALTGAAASAAYIQDAQFNNADWSAFAINTTGGFGFSAGQNGSGGNPGAYRSISQTSDAGFAQGTVIHTHALTWSPGSQGAITDMDMSIQVNCFNGGTSGAVGFGLIVVQGGVVYFGATFTALTGSGWRSDLGAAGLSASTFTSAASTHPDFSTSGGVVAFGFFSSNGTGNGVPISSSSGVDNFIVDIIPAPGAGAALLMVGASSLGRRRR